MQVEHMLDVMEVQEIDELCFKIVVTYQDSRTPDLIETKKNILMRINLRMNG